MKVMNRICFIPLMVCATQSMALSLAPEEFAASRKMACVLAQQTLGQLSEDEYGAKANSVLDGFDEGERDNILAQAVGYYGGLTFSSAPGSEDKMTIRLKDFVASSTCSDDYRQVNLSL
ncbi:MAG TPA: hypothetical protein VIV27_04235 [Halioglobus sp.]